MVLQGLRLPYKYILGYISANTGWILVILGLLQSCWLQWVWWTCRKMQPMGAKQRGWPTSTSPRSPPIAPQPTDELPEALLSQSAQICRWLLRAKLPKLATRRHSQVNLFKLSIRGRCWENFPGNHIFQKVTFSGKSYFPGSHIPGNKSHISGEVGFP